MRNVRAKLSDAAYEAIETFCREQGVTITAALEAWGRRLDRGEFEVVELVEQVMAEAREIDAERRSRRRV